MRSAPLRGKASNVSEAKLVKVQMKSKKAIEQVGERNEAERPWLIQQII